MHCVLLTGVLPYWESKVKLEKADPVVRWVRKATGLNR